MTLYYIKNSNGNIVAHSEASDIFGEEEVFITELPIEKGPDGFFHIQDGTEPPSQPSNAHIWDDEQNEWVYHIELDSPGPGWIYENDQWTKKVFNSMDFQFFISIEKVAKIHKNVPNNSMLAAVWGILTTSQTIDLNDEKIKFLLKCLTTEEYGSILTQDELDVLLEGEKLN